MTAIKAHFDGKVIIPDEPVNLPVNQPLNVVVKAVGEQERPLMRLLDRLNNLPDNPNSPGDAAAEHDHYLYGVPKRNDPS